MKKTVNGLLLFTGCHMVFITYLFCNSFPDVKDIDNEYEIDMFMDYYLPESNQLYWSHPTGLRIACGSMDIKRFYFDEELKIRFPLIDEKFWARFYHKRLKTIDYENNLNEIEFEHSPAKNLFLSLLGTPGFEKYEADLGWAVRYAEDEANGIKLVYILTDFDNNYAFKNRSTNLGFEKFYRKMPRQWKMDVRKNNDSINSRIYFEYNTMSVFDYTDLLNSNENYTKKNEDYKFESNFNLNICPDWLTGMDFYLREDRESKKFSISRQMENFSSDERKVTVRPYVEKQILKNLKIFSGVTFIRHDYEITYAYLSTASYDYERKNMGAFLIGYFDLKPNIAFETGYLHDTVNWSKDLICGHNRENRLKLSCIYKFSKKSQIRIITGWELDSEDLGKFAVFDGGHVQFQALF
ncbi:MAG: hypothetical protein JW983_08335 [Elusimicrobia bacterium]|nr:hypothetical protein [Elusimicrobiota bacterium]